MTSGVPWQAEARATAREAARRSGVSIAEWINSVINKPSRMPERDAAERAPAWRRRSSDDDHREAEALAEVRGRLDEVGRQLDQLSRQNVQAAYPGSVTRASGLAELIGRLDRRLDHLFARGRPDGAAEAGPNAGRPAAAPARARPLEQALLEIAERQRALDSTGAASSSRAPHADGLRRAPTQTLADLEQQLRQLTSQLENLRHCGIEKALDTLRDDLAGIGLLKEAMPRQAIESLENELRNLSARRRLAPRRDRTDGAIASIERGLAEIRDALRALAATENLVGGMEETGRDLSHPLVHIDPNEDARALQHLELAIGDLRGVAAQVASNGALAQLADEVAALAAKVDQLASSADSGANLLSMLEHRIASIADALDHRTQLTPILTGDLDAVVQGLADKLAQIGFARRDPAEVCRSQGRIANLIDKLDAANSRVDRIESIERSLGDLVARLESRQQASRASEVSWLQRDMPQTRNSLETVQGALGSLLERGATIGAGPGGAGLPSAPTSTATAPREARATVPGTSLLASERPMRAVARASQIVTTAHAGAEPAAAPERRPIDPSLLSDQPIEPGALRTRNRYSPGERIAASAALAVANPPVAPDPAGKSNFIAAARRAAQAASGEAARSEKRTPAAAAHPLPEDQPAPAWSNRVRAALVAVSIVIIVLGSRNFVASLLSGPDEPDSTPPAEAQAENGPASVPQTPGRTDNPAGPAPAMFDNTGGGSASALLPGAPATDIQGAASEPMRPITAAPAQDVTGSLAAPVAATPARAATNPAAGAVRQPAIDKVPGTFSSALRAAAATGNAGAEFELAQRYADGRGVPQNLAAAADWLDRAAKQGVILAQFRLGRFYEKGFGVQKDLEAARRLYRSAAEAGNPKAMHNLAVLYAEGIDGKPDYVTAAKWFRQAAAYGLVDSQYNLGILYARGIGVEANLAEAYKWFALAARDGDKEAVSKREDVGERLDPRLLAAAKAELESWTALDQPEAATQAFVPPGGWDAVIPASPANPKPRTPSVKAWAPRVAH